MTKARIKAIVRNVKGLLKEYKSDNVSVSLEATKESDLKALREHFSVVSRGPWGYVYFQDKGVL